MLTKKERLMKALVAELQRQYDGNGVQWLSYGNDGEFNPRACIDLEVEGRIDIALLADAVIDCK